MIKENYFKDLNYTLGNEDTSLELGLVKKYKSQNIVSVTGSGGRSLPLACYQAKELFCVDLSSEQQMLAQLRLATYQQLSYRQFSQFWGYAPYGDFDYTEKRKELFYTLELPQEVEDFFLKLFEASDWSTLLYKGKWERTFQTLAKICRLIMGKNVHKIFEFHDLKEQQLYYAKKFSIRRWKAVLFLLGNKQVFDALLYKGNFIVKNVEENHFDYYFHSFDQIFRHQLARKSFFLNLCFYGKIAHEDGNPVEASEDVHQSLHKRLNSKTKPQISFVQKDILSAIEDRPLESIDFISISDVPSYFSGETEECFLQRIRPHLKDQGLIVVRSYLRVPQANQEGYIDITPLHTELIQQESVQMYRVQILQKCTRPA